MADTQQPKLCPDDLLVKDPRWMMYPGSDYEYVSLVEDYTGVRNTAGDLFAIETDGLVIVRLWPVIDNTDKLQLDTRNPLPCQNEVLRPIEARRLRHRPKIDDVALARWSSPKALETRADHHEIFEAGHDLQKAALMYLYEREMPQKGKRLKHSKAYDAAVVTAMSKLAKVLSRHDQTTTNFFDCLSAAGEMFVRVASSKSVYPHQPGPNLRVVLAYVLGVARMRRRVVRSQKALHDALRYAVQDFPAANALALKFNPLIEHSDMVPKKIPKYNKFTELVGTMLDDVEGASFYFHDGRSTILDPDVPFQKAS